MLCAVVGLAVGGAVALADQLRLAPVAGWMAMATAYAVEVWLSIKGFDAEETDAHATREDPSRPAADLLLVLAAVVSLAAVALVLGGASQATGGTKVAYVALSLGSVVASWFVVHTLYTLHYARLYYGDEVGGIGFNQDNAPSYSDFAYVAFTLGMTFQVSDTDLQTSPIRSAALRHALLSYLFGAGILATTINLVAGLSK
ncbi:MAG: hypothetical protein QOG03_2564 [Actinomycetota bacterium]|nr:hypothetical protein [Actinomycetota bacterium]